MARAGIGGRRVGDTDRVRHQPLWRFARRASHRVSRRRCRRSPARSAKHASTRNGVHPEEKSEADVKLFLPRWIERGDRRYDAARLSDAQQTAVKVSHDDVAVAIPRAADGQAMSDRTRSAADRPTRRVSSACRRHRTRRSGCRETRKAEARRHRMPPNREATGRSSESIARIQSRAIPSDAQPEERQVAAVRRHAEVSRSRQVRRSVKSGSASAGARRGRSRTRWYASAASVTSSSAATLQAIHPRRPVRRRRHADSARRTRRVRQRVERERQIAGRLESRRRTLLQAAFDDAREGRRNRTFGRDGDPADPR